MHLFTLVSREQPRTIVFFEAPTRIIESLQSCIKIFGPDRKVTVLRELTKLYETVSFFLTFFKNST